MAPSEDESRGLLERSSAVEVEIARRALLEPEPVVVGRILTELASLLENVFLRVCGALSASLVRWRCGIVWGRWRLGRLGRLDPFL